jgi:histidinol phosphatase-like enzyme (inositol monophosphatase family)
VEHLNLQDFLDVATEAAYLAGRRTLAYFNTSLDVESKADGTPVTRADREAEQIVREHLLRHFPSHSILGEETGQITGDPGYNWIIDPLDGTKSFVRGVPLFGTLIGLEIDNRPSVGVVYLAALDEMVSAATGLGCRWNGRRARVSQVDRLEDAALSCTSIVKAVGRSDAFMQIASRARLVRGWSDCYGYVLVATGRIDVMLDPAMNVWDSAPFLPILEEAGGRFTDWTGAATIRGADAVATNGLLHPDVVSVLAGR